MKRRLQRIPKSIFQGILKFIVGSNIVATAWIFILTAYVVVDVSGRIFLNAPLQGTPELAKLSIVAITFLQIPYVMLQGRHIRTTVILDRLSPTWKAIVNLFAGLMGLAVFVMIFYGGWNLMIQAYVTRAFEGEGALRVPTQPNRTIIELGSALMVFLFSLQIYNNIKDLLRHFKG